MNREILFRGKRTDNGEWVEGYYVCLNGSQHRIYTGYAETDCGEYFAEYLEVIMETVGRYTGLTDKNGKRIFEGDIIKTHYKNAKKNEFIEDVVFLYGKFMSHKVIYGSHQYMAICAPHEKHLKIDKSVYMDSCEVIGNIHDNPGQEVSEWQNL